MAGLTIGPEADRNTLIRRVSFDLTGLPPTLDEIVTFLSDQSDAAYEHMVERYLASPHYGERWGKYWLDAAGYADSNGYFNADTDRPLAYRYRDYVVRSINADKPWDQFVREQLAGDELAGYKPGGDVYAGDDRTAGSHALSAQQPDGTDSSDGNPDEVRTDKYAVLEGTMQIIGSSLLGLTVQCGKCHDHKFEPFTQQDYYALQAVIYPAFNVEQWVKPKDREIVAAERRRDRRVGSQIESRSTSKLPQRRQQFGEWLAQHRERGKVLFQRQLRRPGSQTGRRLVATSCRATKRRPGNRRCISTRPLPRAQASSMAICGSSNRATRATARFPRSTVVRLDAQRKRRLGSGDVRPGAGSDAAPYVGFLLALRDFNDAAQCAWRKRADRRGGRRQGGGARRLSRRRRQCRGQIGTSGYVPGHNYGVRITNRGNNQFELAFVVDGQLEEGTVTLAADDLPDGGFGFEYCCGRSFAVDNVID